MVFIKGVTRETCVRGVEVGPLLVCDRVKKVVSSSVGHHEGCENLSSSAKDIFCY